MSQADYRKEMYTVTISSVILILCVCGKFSELFIKIDSSEGEKMEDGVFYNLSLVFFKGGNVMLGLSYFNIYIDKVIVTIMCIYFQRLSLQSNEHCDPT